MKQASNHKQQVEVDESWSAAWLCTEAALSQLWKCCFEVTPKATPKRLYNALANVFDPEVD